MYKRQINPVSSSIYEDFYEKYGEGVVHHLKLDVNDTKTTLNSIKEKGVDMIQSGNQLGDSGENQYYYVDTQKKLAFPILIATIFLSAAALLIIFLIAFEKRRALTKN